MVRQFLGRGLHVHGAADILTTCDVIHTLLSPWSQTAHAKVNTKLTREQTKVQNGVQTKWM